MVVFHLQLLIKLGFLWFSLFVVLDSCSWCPDQLKQRSNPPSFEKRTERFWEFDRGSNSWVEVDLPYDLVSCADGDCITVATISKTAEKEEEEKSLERRYDQTEVVDVVLNGRKRISVTRMSVTSIWVTGESGAIYERFWNGVQWVIAPHDLPSSEGPAVSVFLINQTILALSEAGKLYQLHLSESTQLMWTDITTTCDPSTHTTETDLSSPFLIKTGAISSDGERAYFTSMNGSLVELSEIEPKSWIYHGHPPGGDVVAIVDVSSIKPDVVFTVSSSGNLYEYSRSSKPSWRKHIVSKGTAKETSLAPSKGCILNDLAGVNSISLFLLTKTGSLVERRLYQRKWRWIEHGGPKEHHLASITAVDQNELTEMIFSLFFTTTTGSVFEYRLPKYSGVTRDNQVKETWVNHMHPVQAKVARGVPGLQIQVGRILFSLDDARLAELHLSGIGGESSPPTQKVNVRRKTGFMYEWSVIDSPETEGWNAEYCTVERGPSNCMIGVRDEGNPLGSTGTNRRKGGQSHTSYLAPNALHSIPDRSWDQNTILTNGINSNFRMRVMQEGKSFFLITDNGSTFEYLYAENLWLWLRHEHTSLMRGLIGNYNGSLFLVDTHGNLLIRERNGNELLWTNGTALRKGRQITGGPPWDKVPRNARKVTKEDALFFVSKSGRLLQFTVALKNFKWKDCGKPPNSKIAYIVDQETFRDNIVFTVGRNGRLYQYNKVTDLWHEHFQSPHLILSRLPGTGARLSSQSLAGSIFIVAEDGGLVEYRWKALDGWNWVEHGTPYKGVIFVGAPGPCLEYNRLILIGSDGEVYLRYMDQTTWKWKSYGFPSVKDMLVNEHIITGAEDSYHENCAGDDGMDHVETNFLQYVNDHNTNCDSKVASVRPIPFSEDSLIFELRDGRLAELTRRDDIHWEWSRIIGTPTSLCLAIRWTTMTL